MADEGLQLVDHVLPAAQADTAAEPACSHDKPSEAGAALTSKPSRMPWSAFGWAYAANDDAADDWPLDLADPDAAA